MTRKIFLPQPQNVGPNQRVSIRLPLGVTYNKLLLKLGTNITKALITNISLKVNGSERIRLNSANDMQAMNSYKGNANDPSFLEFDFLEKFAKDEVAMEMGAYACTAEAGVQDATIEFDLGTYTPVAGSTLRMIAEVDTPSANPLIQRIRVQQKVLAGAVEEQIIIPSGQIGEQVKRIWIFGTLASIESLRVRREGADEFEALDVATNEFFQKTYGKTPQAGLMVIDFMEHNLLGHILNTAAINNGQKSFVIQNLDIRLKTTAAGTFNIYVESLTTNNRP